MKSKSKMKSYENLRKLLARIKIENPSSISSLLIEVCLSSKNPMGFNQIKQDLVKSKNIFPCKSWKTYGDWRNTMICHGILICMATHQEMSENEVNHKASLFKVGPVIRKYIESALEEQMSIYERLDTKADNEYIEKQLSLKASNERVNELQNTVQELEKKVQAMVELVLEALPPDTPIRRKIAAENYQDKKKCVDALKEEKRSHKKKDTESKKNIDLRVVC